MDPRDRENFTTKWYESFDEENMMFIMLHENEEGEEEEIKIPAIWEVCELCDGKGKHVNPGVDYCGISDEDPDFRDSYMSGAYDVRCYRCKGRTTSPTVNYEFLNREENKKQKDLYEDVVESCYSYDYEREAERRMGC